jgi:hypothetical protein
VEESIGTSRVFVMAWKDGVEEALADLRKWLSERLSSEMRAGTR